jgi:hypothetical protein
MGDEYEGGDMGGDTQDDMIYQDGNREDLDQVDGAEDRTELMMVCH